MDEDPNSERILHISALTDSSTASNNILKHLIVSLDEGYSIISEKRFLSILGTSQDLINRILEMQQAAAVPKPPFILAQKLVKQWILNFKLL